MKYTKDVKSYKFELKLKSTQILITSPDNTGKRKRILIRHCIKYTNDIKSYTFELKQKSTKDKILVTSPDNTGKRKRVLIKHCIVAILD